MNEPLVIIDKVTYEQIIQELYTSINFQKDNMDKFEKKLISIIDAIRKFLGDFSKPPAPYNDRPMKMTA